MKTKLQKVSKPQRILTKSPVISYKNVTLNLSLLESISPDNPAFLVEMVTLFQKQSSLYMEKIKTAFLKNDKTAIRKNAHAFKPLGSYLGIDSLTKLVDQLEATANDSQSKSVSLKEIIDQIELLLDQLKPEIQIFLN